MASMGRLAQATCRFSDASFERRGLTAHPSTLCQSNIASSLFGDSSVRLRHQATTRSLRVSATRSSSVNVTCSVITKTSYGAADVQGSARVVMEDTIAVHVDASGKGPSFFGVFDGHGGTAVAEFLKNELWPTYRSTLASVADVTKATNKAFAEVDQLTLAPPKGFFGMMRERGLGGSKCGACANTAVLLPPSGGSPWQLITANVGDSKTVLSRGGVAVQLSTDHKPEIEAERLRIEKKNPTPLKPLVRQAGGQWRVGGLLALSRAFGDAYLKDWSDGFRDGASGGFGLTAEPSIFVEALTPADEFLVLGTDGLWDVVPNQDVVDIIKSSSPDESLDSVARKLAQLAQSKGSTDDISVIIVKLPQE